MSGGAVGTPPGQPSVSAALIVRNEAPVLAGCLESIASQVDEVVIVDTGSIDDTREIAKSCGARLLEFAWTGDFSAARNVSLDAAKGDWILYIDADERLTVSNGTSLKSLLADTQLAAMRVRLQPKARYTDYLELRLFRNHPCIRFDGVIHEWVIPGVAAVCRSEGMTVGESSEVRIVHTGYDADDHGRKHDRNLPLLRRAVAQNPERVYCWWHLGETLARVGQPDEAETAWMKAIEVARGSNIPQEQAEASLAYQSLALSALSRGRPAAVIVDAGLAANPTDHALKLIKAQVMIEQQQQFRSALDFLSQLTEIDASTYYDPRMSFDRGIFGEFAWGLIGLALFRLDRFGEAAEAYERAAELAEEPLAYRTKAIAAIGRVRRVSAKLATPRRSGSPPP